MAKDPRLATTIDPASRKPPAEGLRIPALTLLCHPDPSRVGQTSWLSKLQAGAPVRLSRLTPKFGATPMDDPHVSRKPVILEGSFDEGIRLSLTEEAARVRVNGEQLGHEGRRVQGEELAAGVVIELGKRVALMLHATPAPQPEDTHLGLLGEHVSMRALRASIRRVAPHGVPVLLRGESGTGKELVAHAIHALGDRAERELVAVNMAAVPATAAASALFGHKRGAFTGAQDDSVGFFGHADGSTLFLDEIGDTPHDVQVSLLRALESGEIQPLGEVAARKVDVRLVAATDADLEAAVNDGRFREALLQRLGGYVLDLPPLRERRTDIARLLVHFLREEMGRMGNELGEGWLPCWLVVRAIQHRWPGNVRELRNAARQLAIDWADAPEIGRTPAVERLFPSADALPPMAASPAEEPVQKRRRLEDIPEAEIIETLRAHGWKPGHAAAALGISRTSLYALMQKSENIRTASDLGAKEISEAQARCDGDLTRTAALLCVSEHGLKKQMSLLGLR